MKKVTVYGQPGCPKCMSTTGMLMHKGIPFEYVDIKQNDDALKKLLDKGVSSLPAVSVDDELLDYDGNVSNLVDLLMGGVSKCS